MEYSRWGIRPTVAAVTTAAALSWFGIGALAYADEAVDVGLLGEVAAEELVLAPVVLEDGAGNSEGWAAALEADAFEEFAEEELAKAVGSDEADAKLDSASTGDSATFFLGDQEASLDAGGSLAVEAPAEGEGSVDSSSDLGASPEMPSDGESADTQDNNGVVPNEDEDLVGSDVSAGITGEESVPDATVTTETFDASDSDAQTPRVDDDGSVIDAGATVPADSTVAADISGSAASQGAVVDAPEYVGWVERDGKMYYYDAQGRQLSGSQQIDGSWYYFDASQGGAMATGLVEEIGEDGSKSVYFQGNDGVRKMGEVELDKGWYYFDPSVNGARVQDSFVRLDGAYLDNGPKTVYYGSDGKMVHGEQQVGSDWYYLDPMYGSRAQNTFVNLTGDYLTWGPKTVYYGAEGAMVYGEQEVGGAWYYLDYERGGDRAHDRFVYLNGEYLDNGPKTVYYGSDGKMVYGEQEVAGDWYYLDPVDGNRAYNRYILLSGAYLDNGPKMVYYGADGKMLHGTHTVDGVQRFFDFGTGAVNKLGWQNPAGLFQVSIHTIVLPSQAYGTGFDYVTPSRITLESTRDECIEVFIGRAYEYLGTPYVWDYALAPGVGVDCAGLVMQCLYATGMDLGDYNPYAHITDPWHDHDANNMSNDSRFLTVSLDSRRRGDLIFYPGHVAIYLGNDQIINAYPPQVKVESLWNYGTPTVVKRPFV